MTNLFLSRNKENYFKKNIAHIPSFECLVCDQPAEGHYSLVNIDLSFPVSELVSVN